MPRGGLDLGAHQLNEIKALSSSVIEVVYHHRGLKVERVKNKFALRDEKKDTYHLHASLGSSVMTLPSACVVLCHHSN